MSLDVVVVAASVATLASVLGAVIAGVTKRLLVFRDVLRSGVEITFEATEDPENDSRLPQIRDALMWQESIAKWNGRASGSLVFGQYIIGGVLASSFVQESLTAQIVGLLGVLVLMSSLVHQRYRPDLQASDARYRMLKLKALIREIEDDLFALKSGTELALTVYEIRQKASAGLSQAEEHELIDVKRQDTDATAA